ncbi:hypothetical protein PMAYCL1PPCAC_10954, partial [Pristionchus mayeri]
YFLLIFTLISLLLYFRVLLKIYRSRKNKTFKTLFYKMTWSLAIYDISFVIAYFIVEIPQDWELFYGFFESINGTIIPQLFWAHQWQCYLATVSKIQACIDNNMFQFTGVAMIAISRMLFVCHPTSKANKVLNSLSLKKIVSIHAIMPLIYGVYVVIFQSPRHYDYHPDAHSITRLGDASSIKSNSNVTIYTSAICAAVSTICYIRVFLVLRKRPFPSWKDEFSVILTSFVLFLSLCAMCAYYIIYKFALESGNTKLFYFLRRITFTVSFSIALINPWCLFLSNSKI